MIEIKINGNLKNRQNEKIVEGIFNEYTNLISVQIEQEQDLFNFQGLKKAFDVVKNYINNLPIMQNLILKYFA